MDDFILALIAVFVILGILLTASAWFPYYPEGVPEEERVIHTFSAGTVGYTQNYVSSVQEFGDFSVGVPQDEILKSAPALEITAGVFGGESEEFNIIVPDYVMEWLLGGEISFTVEDTNQLGNLVIEWNGAELFSKKAYSGVHSIDIRPEQIKSQNTLKIYSQGPGFMFWAASVYKISDFSAVAHYGPAKFIDFTATNDELETLETFELAWYTASRRGNISVKINGDELYYGVPERDMSIEFTEKDLDGAQIRPGNNRITFSPVDGAVFEFQDVLLNTHVSTSKKVVRERFDLYGEDIVKAKANGVTLKMYVEYTDRAGAFNVKLNEATAGTATGRDGWNNIELDASLLEEGSNWIEISSSGAFDVGQASLEFA
ncbi:MAG: hypothetical protein JW789_02210 [Candidatus Aenigmarchaeota archaeon]|nr:hypothetical protein [Candidatus Aenigmarchaeota archaeon]